MRLLRGLVQYNAPFGTFTVLKERREVLGINQANLAELDDVSLRTLKKISEEV